MPSFQIARADDERDERLLICFSHLRWNFVYQRPQHLLSRAAASYRVFFFEEPVFEPVTGPTLRVEKTATGVNVAVPILPQGFEGREVQETLRDLLDGLLAENPTSKAVFWYYTPMAMDFTDHLTADAYVYDCMDELSAFRGAPPELRINEQRLFARADVVFCGGASLYESKRKQHRNAHLFPSSVDRAHFAQARRAGVTDPADQRDISHPRIGFFGVIDERIPRPGCPHRGPPYRAAIRSTWACGEDRCG